jgi:hypothetical protein
VCLHILSWQYLSHRHRVCKKCGEMQFLSVSSLSTGFEYWYNWLTEDWVVQEAVEAEHFKKFPKTAEGFFAEAKQYNNEVNAQTKEEKRKLKEVKHTVNLNQKEAIKLASSVGKNTMESKQK